ncbi:reverse transcriptase domain-containing protein [Tanacetum coccineum]
MENFIRSMDSFQGLTPKSLSSWHRSLAPRSGYQQKDRKPSQNDKTEHGMEKTVQNQGQSPKMPKPEPELKNTIECNLYPSDGPGKPNSISMKTVKTKWALNQLQQPICIADSVPGARRTSSTRRERQLLLNLLRIVLPFQEDPIVEPMADTELWTQLLQAPEGYEDAILILKFVANQFRVKHGLSNLVQNRKDIVVALLLRQRKNQASASAPAPAPELSKLPLQLINTSKAPISDLKWFQIYWTPGFPPVQNSQANNANNFNRGRTLTKTGESNFNQTEFLLPVVLELFPGGNTVTNLKGITTRSGVAYQGPPIPTSSVVKPIPEVTKDQVHPSCSQSTAPVQPPVGPEPITTPVLEPIVAPVVAPVPNTKPSVSLPYPSRRDNEKSRNQANEQIDKFYEIFKEMSFEISFTDALVLMPKFASTLRTLLGNKEKLTEVARTSNEPCLARTSMNEHCSAVILNKLPRKLGDPGKFLIPCEFPGMDECLALADLGASINLMPFSVWEKLSLPDLTPTCMTLELADRSISKPMGIAKDISVKVGVFHFPADFVVVDFEPDPRVPLILGRCFLKTSRALIDVHKGELTLRIGSEAITYNLDQTSRYSANYTHMTANKIDVIDMACEEYSQEVLGFTDIIASGNSTPYYDPIVATSSPTLTPFGDSDFLLLEEADSFLGLADDPDCPAYNPFYYDPEGDILLLEAILNSEPPPPLPNHKQYMPGGRKELKLCEAKTIEPSVHEPPEVELKELPPHLEYAFLEGDNKLPVIIAKELDVEEKSALVKVLKSHKRALAWKLSDIQGINPEFCTHKILMEEDYAPAVQHQRRVNPKIHDVIKKEVEKLLEAGLIYPISDSPWVSPVHCVPKKGGITVVMNEENELIPTRLVTGWREVDIIKKTENQAKMTKLSMEWKRLCKIKAKVQKSQSQSQY